MSQSHRPQHATNSPYVWYCSLPFLSRHILPTCLLATCLAVFLPTVLHYPTFNLFVTKFLVLDIFFLPALMLLLVFGKYLPAYESTYHASSRGVLDCALILLTTLATCLAITTFYWPHLLFYGPIMVFFVVTMHALSGEPDLKEDLPFGLTMRLRYVPYLLLLVCFLANSNWINGCVGILLAQFIFHTRRFLTNHTAARVPESLYSFFEKNQIGQGYAPAWRTHRPGAPLGGVATTRWNPDTQSAPESTTREEKKTDASE